MRNLEPRNHDLATRLINMAGDAVYVLPGDEVDSSLIPQHPKYPLRIGPGLRHVPPSDLIPTLAGALLTDKKKNSIWVEQGAGRVCERQP